MDSAIESTVPSLAMRTFIFNRIQIDFICPKRVSCDKIGHFIVSACVNVFLAGLDIRHICNEARVSYALKSWP